MAGVVLAQWLRGDDIPRYEVVAAFARSPGAPDRCAPIEVGTRRYVTASTGGDFNCGAILPDDGVFRPLVEFTGVGGTAKGSHPKGRLLYFSGWIWGVTMTGGADDKGTIYKFNPSSRELNTVFEFGSRLSSASDFVGYHPQVGLSLDGNGQLWGYTSTSGRAYRVDPAAGTVVPMTLMNNTSNLPVGRAPQGELTFDGVDSMWGVSLLGGASNQGVVFKISQTSGAASTVVSFTGSSGAYQGAGPSGTLLLRSDGYMWGTATTSACRIFKVKVSDGSYSMEKFFQPGASTKGMPNLGGLREGLVEAGGILYAIAFTGDSAKGALLSYDPATRAASIRVLFSVPATTGDVPSTLSVSAASGALFGATVGGGNAGYGTTFQFTTTAGFRNSYLPQQHIPQGVDGNGRIPSGDLWEDPQTGWINAAMQAGGQYGFGGWASISPAAPPWPGALVSTFISPATPFELSNRYPTRNPVGSMAVGPDGTFYGFTRLGGVGSSPPLVSVERGRIVKLKYDAYGRLVSEVLPTPLSYANGPAVDAPLMTSSGLIAAGGDTLFKIDHGTGEQTAIATFTGSTGAFPGDTPAGSLVLSDDQTTAWGMTVGGGAGNRGTIYRLKLQDLSVASVVAFTGISGHARGQSPSGRLLVIGNTLWGVTHASGAAIGGTIFKFDTASNQFTTVFDFDSASLAGVGSGPVGGLTVGADGRLWGATSAGGDAGKGTVYRFDPTTGKAERVFSLTGQSPGNPGTSPNTRLLAHRDGNLYGTTNGAGLSQLNTPAPGGSVFRVRFGREVVVRMGNMALEDRVAGHNSPQTIATYPGGTSGWEFSVMNNSTTDMPDLSLEISGGEHSSDFTIDGPSTISLAAGQTKYIKVKFTPSRVGRSEAKLLVGRITDDVDDLEISLSGEGVARTLSADGVASPSKRDYYASTTEGDGRVWIRFKVSESFNTDVKLPFSIVRGKATTKDFRVVSTSPLTLKAGFNTVYLAIDIVDDYLVEGDQDFSVKFGKPSAPLTVPPETPVVILDNDSAPTADEITQVILELGEMATVSSGLTVADGNPIRGLWLKNGRLANLGFGPKANLGIVSLSDAGVYEYQYRMAGGVSGKTPPITVIVMDSTPDPVASISGANVKLQVSVAGPGIGFEWLRDGKPLPSGTAKYQGLNTESLCIKDVSPDDTSSYQCSIAVQNHDGTFGKALWVPFYVSTSAPQPLPPMFPTGQVGVVYEYSLPFNEVPGNLPTNTQVVGLPPGLKVDPNTSRISGSASRAGIYPVVITMSNPSGSRSVNGSININDVDPSLVGSYEGPVTFWTDYYLVGGRMRCQVAATGAITGSLEFSSVRIPFVTNLEIVETGPPQSRFFLPAVPAVGLQVSFVELYFDGTAVSGNFSVNDNPVASWSGWKNLWSPAGNPSNSYEGAYHLGLEVDGGIVGSGFATLAVQAGGATLVAGRLPDNSIFTSSGILGPGGEFYVVDNQGNPRAGVSFVETITLPNANVPLALIGASGGPPGFWVTPAKKTRTRHFQYGVNWTQSHVVSVYGSRYQPPEDGQPVMGLPLSDEGTPNAEVLLSFINRREDQSMEAKALRIDGSPTGGIFNNAGSTGKRFEVKSITFDRERGTYRGRLTLDADTPNARDADFQGLLVPGWKAGYGFCIVPDSPDPIAVPPTTLRTSQMLTLPVMILGPNDLQR